MKDIFSGILLGVIGSVVAIAAFIWLGVLESPMTARHSDMPRIVVVGLGKADQEKLKKAEEEYLAALTSNYSYDNKDTRAALREAEDKYESMKKKAAEAMALKAKYLTDKGGVGIVLPDASVLSVAPGYRVTVQ